MAKTTNGYKNAIKPTDDWNAEHPVITAKRSLKGSVRAAKLTGRAGVLSARASGGDVAAARAAAVSGVATAVQTKQSTIAAAQGDPNSARSERVAAGKAALQGKADRLTKKAQGLMDHFHNAYTNK